MSMEHPTGGEVIGAAKRLYYLTTNFLLDHSDRFPPEVRDYWDPELWDIAERLGELLGVEVTP